MEVKLMFWLSYILTVPLYFFWAGFFHFNRHFIFDHLGEGVYQNLTSKEVTLTVWKFCTSSSTPGLSPPVPVIASTSRSASASTSSPPKTSFSSRKLTRLYLKTSFFSAGEGSCSFSLLILSGDLRIPQAVWVFASGLCASENSKYKHVQHLYTTLALVMRVTRTNKLVWSNSLSKFNKKFLEDTEENLSLYHSNRLQGWKISSNWRWLGQNRSRMTESDLFIIS